MKFIWNRLPDDQNFDPENLHTDWTPLKESTNMWIVQLQAIPFMILNIIIVNVVMDFLGISFNSELKYILISFIILIPIHEIVHALFFPEKLSSENVYLGFLLKGLVFFAAYNGEIKRKQFIKVLISPFIIISAIGFIILSFIGDNNLIKHIVFFNALSSCGDCLFVCKVLRQVPKNSAIRNKGIRTYWRQEIKDESKIA